MSAARWVECPQCGRSTSLEPDQLEAKRGWCAACAHRFELGLDSRISDRPIDVALVQLPMPGAHFMRVRSTEPLEVEVRTRRSPVVAATALIPAALFAAVLVVDLVQGHAVLRLLFFALLAAAFGGFAWAWYPPKQVLRLEDDRLTVRSFGTRTRALRLDAATDVAAGPTLVISNDRGTIELGRRRTPGLEELRWLRQQIRAAARVTRGKGR